ncbi:hypothetical protein Efla_005052 [Eimeria flavescens]
MPLYTAGRARVFLPPQSPHRFYTLRLMMSSSVRLVRLWLRLLCLFALLFSCCSADENEEVVDFLAAARELPSNTSAQAVRAQPVMHVEALGFYSPASSEPGAVRVAADRQAFSRQSAYSDSAYSRMANPSPLSIFSWLDMFSSNWDDPDEEEDEFLEDDFGNWMEEDASMEARSQPKLRYRRKF